MDSVTVVLVIAATVRLTRLLVDETLPPLPTLRKWIHRRTDDGSPTRTLIGCQWCLSFWVGLAVLASAALVGHTAAWRAVAAALGLSLVTGTYSAVMYRIEDDD